MMSTFKAMMWLMTVITATKMWANFKSKLLVLVLMELMFLLALTTQVTLKSTSSSLMVLLYITIFMVLDSTVGVSILMSSSRNSYYTMNQFKTI